MNKLALITTVLMLTSTAAFAEDMAPSPSTKNFVEGATIGSEFEVESSKLALQKSSNTDIKNFAQNMIDDHTKAGENLKKTLDSADIKGDATKTPLDAQHQAVLDSLKNAKAGTAFDNAYIKAQKDAHKEALSLFQDYSQNGDNAKVKGFAKETLPTLEKHDLHVSKLKAS